jgi:hypothetical protein
VVEEFQNKSAMLLEGSRFEAGRLFKPWGCVNFSRSLTFYDAPLYVLCIIPNISLSPILKIFEIL